METLSYQTAKSREVIDITEDVNKTLTSLGAQEGMCYLFLHHTTAALTIADLDPGTDLDLLDAFEAMVPKLKYRHPHNPGHVFTHILSAVIGASLLLPVKGSRLWLGTWQRIVLIELDGPRERELVASYLPLS